MSAPARPRLFVAVELPAAVRTAIRDATEPWRRSLPDLRWISGEALHLTIAFIGAVDAGQVAAIASAVEVAAAGLAPVPTGLTRFGRFPEGGRAARVLWVGLDDPGGGLTRVAAAVTAALDGFLQADGRPYQPHITIARAGSLTAVPPTFHDAEVPSIRWMAENLTLFRSHLGAGVPRYEPLARWNLQARTPEVP